MKKLKVDLKIGSPNFPSYVILCGDQQTYSIMVELRKNDSSLLDWFYPWPGDWHLMKLISELLKDMLWDGGLKQFCSQCGIKGELVQWQDIHIMLLSTYESLLHVSLDKFRTIPITISYWEWVQLITKPSNKNEVSRFWLQVLIVLHFYGGFYFSIRSGNWILRNAFLKALSPLFFAYGRHKYEDLCVRNIYDTLTLPVDVLNKFACGEWTVSVKGNPYSNLAIDEAHESVINRRLKQITSRPSAFRTVELADFMSYMDGILIRFEEYLFKHNAEAKSHYKLFILERIPIIKRLMHDTISMFEISSDTVVPLTNIFMRKPPSLDFATRKDLLSFYDVGKKQLE